MTPATGRSHTTAAKTSVILNRTGRQADLEPEADMETEEEEEEEEEDNSSLETTTPEPVSPSLVHGYDLKPGQCAGAARGRESSSPHHHHLQELQTGSQFPMSGDLPTMDPGLPSPSLGFELTEVSPCPTHNGRTIIMLLCSLWFSTFCIFLCRCSKLANFFLCRGRE